jgi:hypothetical protein
MNLVKNKTVRVKIPSIYKFNTCVRHVLLWIFLAVFMLACSGGGGSDPGANGGSSSGKGSISFSLVWKGLATSNVRASLNNDACASGVTTITVNVYNASGSQVASASFDCTALQGEIDNIPAGSDYYNFIFLAEDASASVTWTGQITNITLTPGAVTDIGTVSMYPVSSLTTITMSPLTLTVALGYIQQFTATGTFTDNSTQDLTTVVTWTSSDTTVATITAGGQAETVATGVTTIGASLGSISASTVMTVIPAPSYYIAGQVIPSGAASPPSANGLPGVTITLTWSSGSLTTTTDSNGHYSFTNATNGSLYIITPSMVGYTFTPSSLSITVDNANITDQNFTAVPDGSAASLMKVRR